MNWPVLILILFPLATFLLSVVWGAMVSFHDPRGRLATILGWVSIASFTWFVLIVLLSVAIAS